MLALQINTDGDVHVQILAPNSVYETLVLLKEKREGKCKRNQEKNVKQKR